MGGDRRKDTYWVLRREELRCLASPIRMDIVDHLAGRPPMPIRELARRIGKQPSAIYHHLRQLIDVGLVLEAGTQVVNRKSEKLYATPAPRVRLKRALAERVDDDAMCAFVGAMLRQSTRDFAAGVAADDARADGAYRNLGMFRLINRPSKRSLKRVNALLEEIGEILWEEDQPGEPLVALSWVMAPIRADDPGED